eukprot:TRINITY_DN6354_c0_g1_i1.p1 TRINITY_DN6354_c0_g1~~TRINITY_DN6354_c0_g1_i1.p1  ORF type:complete len:270 (-),score=23.69 TRINITY_DN6354_c0_g1_i1:92-901(-)
MAKDKKPIFQSSKKDNSWGKRGSYDPYEEQGLLRGNTSKNNCIRVPLIGFNCILWVLGVVLMFIGGYAFYELKDLQQIANFTVPVGFLVIGVFMTILTIVGCVVGFKGRLKGLAVYTILMFVFFAILIGVGGYAFEQRNNAPVILQAAWAHASDKQRSLLENYFSTATANGTQPCCGWQALDNGVRTYPSSDCKIITNGTNPQNATLKAERPPCDSIITNFVQNKLALAGAAGITIGIIEFFSVLFSFILIIRLCCAPKNRSSRDQYPL